MQKLSGGFLNAFHLKVLMAALMVLDHLYYNLFPSLYWGHVAARVVAPVFCYLIAEGMRYTRNRSKYLLRMLGFGLFMMAGNLLLYALYGSWIENSILLALAVGGALIACVEKFWTANGPWKLLWIAAVAVLLWICNLNIFGGYLLVEGGAMIPIMAVIFYFLRNRPIAMWLTYFLVYGVQYIVYWRIYGVLYEQFWMILAFVPLLCYNGKRGPDGMIAKYFFYLFYPAHLWIIFFMERAAGMR